VGLIATCRCVLQAGGGVLLSDRFIPDQALARLSDPALGVTHLFGVPQMAQALVDSPAFPSSDLSRLKGLFLGGAPLPEALCRTLLDRGVLVVNGYGMTEASTVVGMPLDAELVTRRMASAGLAAPAVDIRICDAEGEVLGPSQVGEICLRGPAITPGYWNQPEATAAAFRGGWLRTGDAGYLDEDGYLFLVDRWKDMYISGGENVYPAEVESAISLLAGVREVAVVGKPDGRWGEVGCAFVVLQPGAAVTAQEVIAHCQGRLARYKHPVEVRFVDTLPRTASGKLRKNVLRDALA
jgi:fatty-acyl-CoA synthase